LIGYCTDQFKTCNHSDRYRYSWCGQHWAI